MGSISVSGVTPDAPYPTSVPLPIVGNQVSRTFPVSVIAAVTNWRAAGVADIEIASRLEAAGLYSPAFYGFTNRTSDTRWHPAAVAALRAANGIS